MSAFEIQHKRFLYERIIVLEVQVVFPQEYYITTSKNKNVIKLSTV